MNRLNALLTTIAVLVVANPAFAQEAGNLKNADNLGLVSIGAALAIGLAALGGAMGQGRAAAAALEGIARNPSASEKVFTPFLLGLALIESLVLMAFLVAAGFLGPLSGKL
jgi:F-type H+-transporting ATPase subunit c